MSNTTCFGRGWSSSGFCIYINAKTIRKVTSGELLTRQAMRKTLYAKNTYIHKLLLNIVTAGTEAVVSGNTFLYACVKEACRL
jgi:hypothetical protein